MTLPPSPAAQQPLRKSAQRLRWFVDAFEKQVRNTEAQTKNSFSVDRDALAQVFVEWLQAFDAQKPARDEDKEAYVGFAAGLMLKALVENRPVKLAHLAERADETNPAYFWPEGYLYVAFCLNVRGLVLEADFQSTQELSAVLSEARTWWSFRENVSEDPSLAIAFLDLFAGDEPEWTAPGLFKSGRIHELAGRFYKEDTLPPTD
ncbi:MAG: hypothetical protein AAGA70_14975 [Pseudomonadota bacterium]